MMKISIIIPFYNLADYIERALCSALSQTYSDIEFILVNDASTDTSIDKVHGLLKTHKRSEAVKLIEHSKNRGVAAARNTGLDHSIGDYVFFLDGDDELPVNAIEDLLAVVGEHEEYPDIIIGDFEVVGGRKSNYVAIDKNETGINRNVLASFLSKEWYDGTCNKLERREVIQNNNLRFYEGIVHEDVLWSFELSMHALSLKFCHKTTYLYHIRQDSITQRMSLRNFSSLVIVLERMVEIAKKKDLYTTQPELGNYLANLRIYLLKGMIKSNVDKLYLRNKINEVNRIFSSESLLRVQSLEAFLILSLYRLPTFITVLLVKLLLFTQRVR